MLTDAVQCHQKYAKYGIGKIIPSLILGYPIPYFISCVSNSMNGKLTYRLTHTITLSNLQTTMVLWDLIWSGVVQ